MQKRKKDTINMLMNINDYMGQHQSRVGPIILFLVVSATPFLLYTFLFLRYIPLKIMIIIELLWTARMALLILGREKEKVILFEQALKNEYASANDLVKIVHVHDDGLIEYANSNVVYIVSAYCMTYDKDDALSVDMEEFLSQLRGYNYDIFCQLAVDEFKLQNDLERMSVYTDRAMMRERMNFYIAQDEFCHKNVSLYRINFAVKASKYDWKSLRKRLDEIVNSDAASVFKYIYICDRDEASDIISRDICANVNLKKMLVQKHQNSDYRGSKVLYYGDEIPEEFKAKKEETGFTRRRVVYQEGEK